MGRRQTPTAIKELNGNPGRRPLPQEEPKPEACLPDAPEHFDFEHQQKFNEVARILYNSRVLTVADTIAVEMLVRAIMGTQKAVSDVEHAGTTSLSGGQTPTLMVSPEYKVMKYERDHLLSMLREFGMTPSSRASIKVADVPKLDPLAEMLARRQKRAASN